MTNINDLFAATEDIAPAVEGPEQIPDGTEAVARIAAASAKMKGSKLSISALIEIEDGDYAGSEFWDFLSFSDKPGKHAARYNKGLFGKLEAAGLGPDFFRAGPSADSIKEALKGAEIVIKVGWDEKADGDGYWGRHVWKPADAAVASAPAEGGPKGWG